MKGREQLRYVNPYQTVNAATMAVQGGLETVDVPIWQENGDAKTDIAAAQKSGENAVSEQGGAGCMAVTGIDSGDFFKVQGVDFGERAPEALRMTARYTAGKEGLVQVRIDSLQGQVLGYMPLGTLQDKTAAQERFDTYEARLEAEVTGVHDLFFIFFSGESGDGGSYEIGSWQFVRKEEFSEKCPAEVSASVEGKRVWQHRAYHLPL